MPKIYRTNKPLDNGVKKHIISIRLDDTELERLKKLSNDLKIPQSRLLRNMALIGLEEAEALHKFRILKGAKKLDDFRKALGKERADAEPKLEL